MAGKRGKSQAKRNSGNGGLPGWAWGVLGLVLGIGLILAAPRVLRNDGDGFLRPRPNPDAQPAPVEGADELGAEPAATVPEPAAPKDAPKKTDFDFYTVLPGREVRLSDAELAATAQAEAEREARAAARPAGAADGPAGPAAEGAALPVPVAEGAAAEPVTPVAAKAPAEATPPEAAAAPDSTRYLLQAGAFEASGQAEELKAKIAMLGVGARVESARINGRTVFRVRMGPYGSASELADAKRRLASGGLPAIAIKVE